MPKFINHTTGRVVIIQAARAEPQLPSLARQTANYAVAKTKDLLGGKPRRTPEECARIVKEFCEPCEHFRQSDRKCSKCGCPVVEKIPMKREHCPVGKW